MSVPVGVSRCDSYSRDVVYLAVKKAIDAAGGLPPLKGKKVLLKPNLLAEVENGIERGVCTNPALVYAVGKIVLEEGGILNIADSPGGGVPNTPAGIKKTYVGCGIDAVAEELGITLSYDLGYTQIKSLAGNMVKRFPIINAVANADIIISIPKLKTHLFTAYTGAVKNMFGVIPGKIKSEYHPMFPNPNAFSEMLVDLNETVKSSFIIMDAVIGMEGDGPSGGNPRKIGYILASTSVYALDVIAQKLINLDPKDIATTSVAIKRKLVNLNEITVSGDEIIPINDFKRPSTYTNYVHDENLPKYIQWIRRYTTHCRKSAMNIIDTAPFPYVSINACTACGKCIESCNSSAISLKNNLIEFNHKICSHCNTCFVICPVNAISMLPSQKIAAIRKLIVRYPIINNKSCIACGQCIRICPMNTISFIEKKAHINLEKCIRCYCCHEMCGYNAISLKDPKLLSLYHKVRK